MYWMDFDDVESSHNMLPIPQNRVSVEICSWVEPKIDTLLPASSSICKYVRLQYVGLAWHIAQELEVHFIM